MRSYFYSGGLFLEAESPADTAILAHFQELLETVKIEGPAGKFPNEEDDKIKFPNSQMPPLTREQLRKQTGRPLGTRTPGRPLGRQATE